MSAARPPVSLHHAESRWSRCQLLPMALARGSSARTGCRHRERVWPFSPSQHRLHDTRATHEHRAGRRAVVLVSGAALPVTALVALIRPQIVSIASSARPCPASSPEAGADPRRESKHEAGNEAADERRRTRTLTEPRQHPSRQTAGTGRSTLGSDRFGIQTSWNHGKARTPGSSGDLTPVLRGRLERVRTAVGVRTRSFLHPVRAGDGCRLDGCCRRRWCRSGQRCPPDGRSLHRSAQPCFR